MRTSFIVGWLGMFFSFSASAAALYVDLISANPTPPFTNWTTAATNIQDAVDVAVLGDEIIVTNGVYQTGACWVDGVSNRVAVTKAVTVRSVNGSAVTRIVGYRDPLTANGPAAVRCVYLTNGAVLAGFTLTNGATQASSGYTNGAGGGVWCMSMSAIASNCVLTGNSAIVGGGAYGGSLKSCVLNGNSASQGGGAHSSMLNNCALSGNLTTGIYGSGGGAYDGTLNNCTLASNSAYYRGGGAYGGTLTNCSLAGNSVNGPYCSGGGTFGSTLTQCTLATNSANGSGGGAFIGALNNCTLTGNSGTYGGGSSGATLNNCTLAGNSAFYGGGTDGGTLNNCIVYYNTAQYSGANYFYGVAHNSCTTPLPVGTGNFTNAPLFVNTNRWSDLRLQTNSPCINSGSNEYTTSSTDLDGNPRIVSGTVDMGAFEFQGSGSVISYAWLQRYGWPTDGTVDFTDIDGDGADNWHESRADTIPTNALSVLKTVAVSNATLSLNVTWQSVATRSYFLERATNLATAPPFTLLATNLAGLPGTTTFTDPTAIGSGPFFYRVGVGN